ncbi:MAG: ABC transporter permease [Clostridium sp.]
MEFKHLLRVIRARFIVKCKIYFRYPLNLFYFFVDPIVWISPFYFMAKVFGENGNLTGFEAYTGSGDFMSFLVLGYMTTSYVSAAMWSVGFSIKEEMLDGVLESNWTSPVNRASLVLSNTAFEFFKTTLEVISTGILSYILFDFRISGEMLKALMFMIPGVIALMGIGLMTSAIVLVLKNANSVIDIGSSLIQGLAGGFFPIQVLGRYLIIFSLAIPLTYMNDSIRAILINQTPIIPLEYQFIILMSSMFLFIIVGAFVFNKIERKCRENGLQGY